MPSPSEEKSASHPRIRVPSPQTPRVSKQSSRPSSPPNHSRNQPHWLFFMLHLRQSTRTSTRRPRSATIPWCRTARHSPLVPSRPRPSSAITTLPTMATWTCRMRWWRPLCLCTSARCLGRQSPAPPLSWWICWPSRRRVPLTRPSRSRAASMLWCVWRPLKRNGMSMSSAALGRGWCLSSSAASSRSVSCTCVGVIFGTCPSSESPSRVRPF
mmetsp:Transcript_5340/g.14703  ORF Transcript_5340/g.14703 Transcript_5340/m.14703 type:complete len:213 (+) Transcript_5340:864-1502(+)